MSSRVDLSGQVDFRFKSRGPRPSVCFRHTHTRVWVCERENTCVLLTVCVDTRECVGLSVCDMTWTRGADEVPVPWVFDPTFGPVRKGDTEATVGMGSLRVRKRTSTADIGLVEGENEEGWDRETFTTSETDFDKRQGLRRKGRSGSSSQ